jgi:hypothetical protein
MVKGIFFVHISHPYIYLPIHRSALSLLGGYGLGLSSVRFHFFYAFEGRGRTLLLKMHSLSNY